MTAASSGRAAQGRSRSTAKKVASGKIERTIPFIYGVETADVGMDLYTPGHPRLRARATTQFTGTIKKVTIDVNPELPRPVPDRRARRLSPIDVRLQRRSRLDEASRRKIRRLDNSENLGSDALGGAESGGPPERRRPFRTWYGFPTANS